ncbi:MAG: extracellular solute-binding protein, partial [Alphaproteobacteria bacterium]|nr:extracellular solute-binding protein [Alphaproteobacteria bacterium]
MNKTFAAALAIALFMSALLVADAVAQGTGGPAHGIAMHGGTKYTADFTHFDYVNPAAPKGGTVVRDAFGSFDSLNPFIVQGTAATGLGLIYDSLTVASADEAFTRYCLICETMNVPDDRSWVEFVLRADAFWHDGEPITVEDVIFSFETLREANPFTGAYYADVTAVTQTGPRSVRFEFGGETNMELPLIVSELTVLPKHYWEDRTFNETTLEPPLGSGPYRIRAVQTGASIAYERVEDYWARDHPVNVGSYNFDLIRYEYFRDRDVAREAFKGGDIDFWVENQSKAWATAFDVPAVAEGLIVKEEAAHERGAGMQGYVLNTRRPKFQDRKVREALSYAFDFETTNRDLFYGAYTRTDSYFENSELASSGLLADAGAEEREILERFREQLPDELYSQTFTVPTTGGGPGGARENIARGAEILTQAGWPIVDGVRVNEETGDVLEVEILLVSPA